MGDSSQLEALLRRTRVDTLGSVDIADGLDLDFLAAITSEDEEFGDDGPINMGYLDTGPANVGYLDTYTDPFAVSGHGEHHDKPRTRKLSFDTLFGFGNSQFEERSHQRADSISSIGLRYGFGKQGGKPGGYRKPSSGTDSEADMPLLFGDESPYVAHAKLLQTRGKEELKDKEKDKEKERRRIDVLKVQVYACLLVRNYRSVFVTVPNTAIAHEERARAAPGIFAPPGAQLAQGAQNS